MIRNIEKFGSMENVRDKAAPWGEILSHLTRPTDVGTEIWKITNSGEQLLYAIFKKGCFKIIE